MPDFPKNLENWLSASDDESIRRNGSLEQNFSKSLSSPLARQTFLDVLHSGSLHKDYNAQIRAGYDFPTHWYKKESNVAKDIEKPAAIFKQSNGAVNWVNSLGSYHRENGKPALISGGFLEYREYGLSHRIDGAAFELEHYDDGNHTIWNKHVDVNYKQENSFDKKWFLFGSPTPEHIHKSIVDFHYSSGVALEVAFLLVNTKQNLSENMIDPTLPLLWQIKLAKGSLSTSNNIYVRTIENWFEKKKKLGQENQKRFSVDLIP